MSAPGLQGLTIPPEVAYYLDLAEKTLLAAAALLLALAGVAQALGENSTAVTLTMVATGFGALALALHRFSHPPRSNGVAPGPVA